MAQNSKEKNLKPESVVVTFDTNVDKALEKAVDSALLTHKRAGVPAAIWRNEKVVLLQPEEIEIDEGTDK